MNTIIKSILTFTIGAAAGTLAGYMTAPRSGKKTRTLLNKEYKTNRKKFEELGTQKLQEAKQILNESLDKSASKSKKLIDQAKENISLS